MEGKKQLYCGKCNKFVNASIKTSMEKHRVFKDVIKMKTDNYICPKCKTKLYDEVLESTTIKKVYDEYRKKNHLLSPEEIKNIRKMYGLSQREFSLYLGWGEKTICRYEGGAIQDTVHNDMLLLLRSYAIMKVFNEYKKEVVDIKLYSKVKNVVDEEIDPANPLQGVVC